MSRNESDGARIYTVYNDKIAIDLILYNFLGPLLVLCMYLHLGLIHNQGVRSEHRENNIKRES